MVGGEEGRIYKERRKRITTSHNMSTNCYVKIKEPLKKGRRGKSHKKIMERKKKFTAIFLFVFLKVFFVLSLTMAATSSERLM